MLLEDSKELDIKSVDVPTLLVTLLRTESDFDIAKSRCLWLYSI